jgi:hypothetical protein
MGFSLDQIKTLVSGGGAGECRQMRDLLKAKLEEIGERMKGLRAFLRVLSRHLQTCEAELARHGSTANCPVIVEISHSGNREVKK